MYYAAAGAGDTAGAGERGLRVAVEVGAEESRVGERATMATKGPQQELQLFAFDARLGLREGHEEEKVLAFAPSTAPTEVQVSVIGLCQAIITFTSTFSPEQPAEVTHTDRATSVYLQCEKDIWMVRGSRSRPCHGKSRKGDQPTTSI